MQKNYTVLSVSIFTLVVAILAMVIHLVGDKQVTMALSWHITGTTLTIMATGFILSPNSVFSTKVAGWFILGVILSGYLISF